MGQTKSISEFTQLQENTWHRLQLKISQDEMAMNVPVTFNCDNKQTRIKTAQTVQKSSSLSNQKISLFTP